MWLMREEGYMGRFRGADDGTSSRILDELKTV